MASFNAVIEHLHEVNLVSMLVRFAIALLGGGIIGMSRGKRQHAAGLRTHLLVCIGAADIRDIYLPMGFSHFKIEGRTLGSAVLLEFLLHYLTRPEYHLPVREEIYLDGMLDLF